MSFTPGELRAAAAALTAGVFCEGRRSAIAPIAVATDEEGACVEGRGESMARSSAGPSVRVLAAHSGAGASTIAVSIADAAAESMRVRLVDSAAPAWTGLAGATDVEMGSRGGWRRGRRGTLLIVDRLVEGPPTPDRLPVPEAEGTPASFTVLDAGWSARELTAHPGCWLAAQPAAADVIVTRSQSAALSQLEALLAEPWLSPRLLLVVVGAKRWAGPDLGAAGWRTQQLCDKAVFAPLLSRGPALGPEPLPKPMRSLGRAVLKRLTETIGFDSDHNHKERP